MTKASASDVPSPCIGVCRMVQATGFCEGCHRTLDEISAWPTLPPQGKLAVWRLLRMRRASLQPAKPPAP